MEREKFISWLKKEGPYSAREGERACVDAIAWVEATPGTPQELWEVCQRGGWMEWLLAVLTPLNAEYLAARAPLYAKYNAALPPLYAEYLAARAPLNEKYRAALAPLYAKHLAARASLIRKFYPAIPPVWEGK